MVEIKHKDTGGLLLRLDADTLAGVDVHSVDLRGADLRGADLGKANLSRWCQKGHDPLPTDVPRSRRGLDLSGADLTGANLQEARMLEVNLQSAILASTDLRGANLLLVNLRKADLSHANLEFATMSGCDLTGANLTGANLRTARLDSTVFRHHPQQPTWTSLRGAILTDTLYDRYTAWPPDYDPQRYGAVLWQEPETRDPRQKLISMLETFVDGRDRSTGFVGQIEDLLIEHFGDTDVYDELEYAVSCYSPASAVQEPGLVGEQELVRVFQAALQQLKDENR
jgi:uncharacterized protein YjbI with pentapeptide repeats